MAKYLHFPPYSVQKLQNKRRISPKTLITISPPPPHFTSSVHSYPFTSLTNTNHHMDLAQESVPDSSAPFLTPISLTCYLNYLIPCNAFQTFIFTDYKPSTISNTHKFHFYDGVHLYTYMLCYGIGALARQNLQLVYQTQMLCEKSSVNKSRNCIYLENKYMVKRFEVFCK